MSRGFSTTSTLLRASPVPRNSTRSWRTMLTDHACLLCSFHAEVEAFHALCDQNRQHSIDLPWLALLLMVLSLALDSLHHSRSPLALDPTRTMIEEKDNPLEAYGEETLKKMPERWFGASLRALRLAEFETVPRIRSIQVRTGHLR